MITVAYSLATAIIFGNGTPQSATSQSKVTNIVVIRKYSDKLKPLVTSQDQFSGKEWVDKLGKDFCSSESDGLLVVAERSALIGPTDRALSKLLELGALDASGAVVDVKTQKELSDNLSGIVPMSDYRDAMSSGKFKLQILPCVRVLSKDDKGQNNFVFFRPNQSVGASDGLNTVIEHAEPQDRFVSARNVVVEEYYRNPDTAPRVADSFKVWKSLADSFHNDLMRQLYARCASQFGGGLEDPEKAFKDVRDWKDVPFDLKSSLLRQRATFVGQKSIPSDGAISNVRVGIDIRIIMAGPGGMTKSLTLNILK